MATYVPFLTVEDDDDDLLVSFGLGIHAERSLRLDKEKVEKVLDDENAPIQIALAEQELSKLGISGVPFYIINNKHGISGAQPKETFMKAFQEIGAEKV